MTSGSAKRATERKSSNNNAQSQQSKDSADGMLKKKRTMNVFKFSIKTKQKIKIKRSIVSISWQ